MQVLSRYQEDMLTVESFGEFCDVMGELGLQCYYVLYILSSIPKKISVERFFL